MRRAYWLKLTGACMLVAATPAYVRAQAETQPPAETQPQAAGSSCSKADFQAVVDGAAVALRDLNQKNRPLFQEKLRELKTKRGWSEDEFLSEAAPLVKDDKTDAWDETSGTLLARITAMGQEEAGAPAPDCKLMAQLNDYMQQLVKAQTDKWAYLFAKLTSELTK